MSLVFSTGSVSSPFLLGHNNDRGLELYMGSSIFSQILPTLKNFRRIAFFTLTVSYSSFVVGTDFPTLVLSEGNEPLQ